MSKFILQIIFLFIIGIVGGIFADQLLWPYFVERPFFLEYRLEQAPVYLNETKEVFIQENKALEEAVEKVEKSIISIKTKNKKGKILEGSGLIVTYDGLAVTLAELVPEGGSFTFYIKEDSLKTYQEVEGKILKRDLKNNLAEIKLDKTDLSHNGFADFDKIKLGRSVFLIGTENSPPSLFVNQGLISAFNQNLIETNIFETKEVAGSCLFDIEAGFLGLNQLDENGRVKAIPVNLIRNFLNF